LILFKKNGDGLQNIPSPSLSPLTKAKQQKAKAEQRNLEGSLQILLAGDEHAPLPVHLISPHGRMQAPKVRAFVDFAVARLKKAPWLPPALHISH
jgi:hypothetical protein